LFATFTFYQTPINANPFRDTPTHAGVDFNEWTGAEAIITLSNIAISVDCRHDVLSTSLCYLSKNSNLDRHFALHHLDRH